MLLRANTPASADDLERFFETLDYVVERRDETLVHVRPASALGPQPDRERAVRDLEAWQAWNPGARAELVD